MLLHINREWASQKIHIQREVFPLLESHGKSHEYVYGELSVLKTFENFAQYYELHAPARIFGQGNAVVLDRAVVFQ